MVHERYRQTDRRQTDGRTKTYSEREREFTLAKNLTKWFIFAVLDEQLGRLFY